MFFFFFLHSFSPLHLKFLTYLLLLLLLLLLLFLLLHLDRCTHACMHACSFDMTKYTQNESRMNSIRNFEANGVGFPGIVWL